MATPSKQVKSTTHVADQRRTQTRVQICIPKHLHGEPVISRLASHYSVTVYIASAQMDETMTGNSCFILELRGTKPQIDSALTYLDELDIEFLHQSTPEEDGW
ncbi:NIL domain-containing protein [Calothrix sp. PCC 7507]|uniref:NIL domain-containing protein n=1 Tax=Calothrix sp. PCC 7507 TaxID=99598 RepID=UPI00029F2CDF|nr:NIL domain-containing protein [Calothrix sp. PCC 7507]AFY35175.1 NIL domain-containing protein [Calothrix sp. PCC 7507]